MSLLRISLLFFMAVTILGCAGLSRQEHPQFKEAISFDPATKRQVLEVIPSGENIFKAVITAWAYENGNWRKAFGPWPAVIGRNGLAALGEKREGDGRTPAGIYRIKKAFGIIKDFNTGLTYQQTTADDIWIDDVASAQYNQWVKLPTDAASYEDMRRSDGLYDLGAVIEYNTDPIVPGYGSAIFIHIWRDNGKEPTAGCVALDRKHLQYLLKWLKASMMPEMILHQ